jgi:hypothetical protein
MRISSVPIHILKYYPGVDVFSIKYFLIPGIVGKMGIYINRNMPMSVNRQE